MEAPQFEPSFQADSNSSSSSIKLPLKKRVLHKKDSVSNESPDLNSTKIPTTILLDEEETTPKKDVCEKPIVDQTPPKVDNESKVLQEEHEPSLNIFLHQSSMSYPSNIPSPTSSMIQQSQLSIICKFCGQQFSSTQALDGHQNAHKQEREIMQVMKATDVLGKNPFIDNLSSTRTPVFQGIHYGPYFRYSPYFGYAYKAWKQRAMYSDYIMSLVQGPSSNLTPVISEGLLGSSSANPTGFALDPPRCTTMPYFHVPSSPMPSYCIGSTSMKENDDGGLNTKQALEPTKLSLPFINKSSETKELDSSPQENISSQIDLDLTLKL